MNRFDGRVALVTGASRGIGEAIARRLAAEGATLLAAARSTNQLDRVVADIAAAGGRARALALDVSDASAIDAVIKSALEEHGQIDVLVNNAGIAEDNLILRMSREAWDRVIATNLTGAFLLTQAVVKGMVRRRYGRIIGITSVVGVMGNPGQANYAASKAGMIGFSKALAQEVASRSVTVNCVAPGFIASPMTDALNEQQRTAILGRIPSGRLGEGSDVAAACIYLASEEAAYVTGQTLHVNGGMAML